MREELIELAPGISIVKPVPVGADDDQDDQRRRNVAERDAIAVERRESRKKELLARAEGLLLKGERVEVSEEMEELGIGDEIRGLAFKIGTIRRTSMLLADDDDEDDPRYDDPNRWL